jgi:RNA polymerase sigma-70 factor (ECF subfamily)
LKAAVIGDNPSLARRQLGELRDEADHDDALDVLAEVAASGSPLATELLIEALDRFGVARHAVRRFIVDDAAVDDVVQDTLITVAQSIGSFRGEARITTWLHQVARNRAVDHLRRARAAGPMGPGGGAGAGAGGGAGDGPGGPGGPGGGDTAELDGIRPGSGNRMSSLVASREAVRQLLDELPDRYRDAVLLRDVERLPYAEVATRLGRNLNTVKSHVARGRALLAALLIERGQEP